MEITLILKGATPAEVREALKKFYEEGTPGPIKEPRPIEETATEKRHRYTDDQDNYILRGKADGYSYAMITKGFNSRFGTNVTDAAICSRWHQIKEAGA